MGGGKDDDSGVARIFILSFTQSFEIIDQQSVGPDGMNCVYSITRMPFENVFFAGGYGSVASFFLDEHTGKIQNLRNFEDIMTGEILDLKFENDLLYVLSPTQEEIARLNFGSQDVSQDSAPQELNQIATYLREITKKNRLEVFDLQGKL